MAVLFGAPTRAGGDEERKRKREGRQGGGSEARTERQSVSLGHRRADWPACLPSTRYPPPLQAEAERQSKIREEVKHELRMFYCQVSTLCWDVSCTLWRCAVLWEAMPCSAADSWDVSRAGTCMAHPPPAPPHASQASPLHAAHQPLPSRPASFRTPWPQVCHKQYHAAHEMEEHLSSYDHHHRKRLAETRAMLAERK